MKSILSSLPLAAASLVLSLGTASALTITETDTFSASAMSLGNTVLLNSVTLNQFDDLGGLRTLQSVKITLDATISGNTTVQALVNGNQDLDISGNVSRAISLDLTPPFGGDLPLSHTDTWNSSLDPNEIEVHNIASIQTVDMMSSDALVLTFFTGAGSVSFDIFGTLLDNLTFVPADEKKHNLSISGVAQGLVTVVYEYTVDDPQEPTEVPEPTMLGLFGAALLGLGVVHRRRRRA